MTQKTFNTNEKLSVNYCACIKKVALAVVI